MKKKFLIYSSSNWAPGVGGTVFLHKLCHDINALGETAFITDKITHPNLNSPYYKLNNETIHNIDDYIVVYPGFTNPLNANKNIVRLILHPKRANEINKYKETDLKFIAQYNDKLTHIPYIHTNFIDYKTFKNKNILNRKGTAYMIRKGTVRTPLHPNDSILLDSYTSDWEKMADYFNNIETFFCYDNVTFWTVLAALCGCVVITVPEVNSSTLKQIYTTEEWRSMFYHKFTGIAYGTCEREVEYAKTTSHSLYNTLLEADKKNIETVKNFIQICHNTYS